MRDPWCWGWFRDRKHCCRRCDTCSDARPVHTSQTSHQRKACYTGRPARRILHHRHTNYRSSTVLSALQSRTQRVAGTHLVTILQTSKRVAETGTLGDTVVDGEGARVVRGPLQETLVPRFGYTARVAPTIRQRNLSLLRKSRRSGLGHSQRKAGEHLAFAEEDSPDRVRPRSTTCPRGYAILAWCWISDSLPKEVRVDRVERLRQLKQLPARV